MPIYDDRSSNRNYKKPNPQNLLVDDVARLRDFIDQVDGDLAPTGHVFTTAQNNAIATIVNSAPTGLQTLAALAAAINNDANFHQTLQTALDDRYTEAEADARFGVKAAFYGFTKTSSGTLSVVISDPNDASASFAVSDYDESAISPAGQTLAVNASGHLTATF